ncbi:MAG: 4-hydroxy-3-methylbut-2-en-1-yl diphosphate synthase (ferredoxin) [Chlamydiales bacterium]|nr:4-hydroxy-3-methylbut-2-en-1-yl diphosphate synthase (ferredoxin) [Chlamydiales bacterium]MCH9636145.1 4-hydroxy-3-methylbut-2-en-1-yl diphosphate synthase (ferredoxin) [Chlamydiales bacterium]
MKKFFESRVVMVGNVAVGGKNPIRIQSMTTTDTRDAQATADQIIKLADAGCEIARVTVQGKREAAACEQIKNLLVQRGYSIPLVADIHFYPPAAMMVADFCDKVRINPGNFVDKRASFKQIDYDDHSYAAELQKIEEKFSPLVEKCKGLKRALRIGTNHGSLSDRIMNRYGDTAKGMVESALEFGRICRAHDFHNVIFSMKASNTAVMTHAYRLLVEKMMELGWDYPLHLGVTEAGEGEDGRVKSAIGIGSLLLDGLGDTIRVSLTEDPWHEIPPCKELATFVRKRDHLAITFPRRKVSNPLHRDGAVVLKLSLSEVESDSFFADLGCSLQFGAIKREPASVDGVIADFEHPKLERLKAAGIAVFTEPTIFTEDPKTWNRDVPIAFYKPSQFEGGPILKWIQGRDFPLILHFSYEQKDPTLRAAAEMGSLLLDGLGEGICLESKQPLAKRRQLAFSILQGARMRSSKTEFISCPGCGRTLFNLQEVAAKIREKTEHLIGVKIAIMGCIVNGPGEMADADFGYVGSRPGMIDLYVGKECVERNIPMEQSCEKLVELIKKYDSWVEPNGKEVDDGAIRKRVRKSKEQSDICGVMSGDSKGC